MRARRAPVRRADVLRLRPRRHLLPDDREVEGPERWQSVMLTGRAELLTAAAEVERAMFLVSERNPSLSPALNRTKIGAWTRLSRVALYRLRPDAAYGRRTV